MPGRSQKVVPAGWLRVCAARSPTTAGSTFTAPAGAFVGPAAGFAHTRATDGATDAGGRPAGFSGAPGVPTQPAAPSTTSAVAAAGNARRHLSTPTRPS
ncbi:hypothetical protein TPA0909_57720 [Streptomyces albus]|nr:hypothetical protein TPA0909_57720 [Streptomyces albus]